MIIQSLLLIMSASGFRSNASGLQVAACSRATQWCGSVWGIYGYHLYFVDMAMNPGVTAERSAGLSVRCIQEFTGVPAAVKRALKGD